MTLYTGYFVAAVALLLWTTLLWLSSLLGLGKGSARRVAIALGLVALAGTVAPLGELTLWRWLMSVHANPSVLLVGFLSAYVAARLTGQEWLSARERLTAYALGTVAGTLLYGSATGFLSPDLYASAWEGNGVILGVGLVAVALIVSGNRIGILVAVALAGHLLDLIESTNIWDYVIDPAFWLLSVCGLLHAGVRRVLGRSDRSPAPQTAKA